MGIPGRAVREFQETYKRSRRIIDYAAIEQKKGVDRIYLLNS
jgi:hypothetical protein